MPASFCLSQPANQHKQPARVGKEAGIVFMPYNYLLDPSTRRNLADSLPWQNSVVIFDEAHNVEGVSSDACSFDITARHLSDAMAETKR